MESTNSVPLCTQAEIALLRSNVVSRVDAGQARDILMGVGIPFPIATRAVLDSRMRWRRLAAGVVTVAGGTEVAPTGVQP